MRLKTNKKPSSKNIFFFSSRKKTTIVSGCKSIRAKSIQEREVKKKVGERLARRNGEECWVKGLRRNKKRSSEKKSKVKKEGNSRRDYTVNQHKEWISRKSDRKKTQRKTMARRNEKEKNEKWRRRERNIFVRSCRLPFLTSLMPLSEA